MPSGLLVLLVILTPLWLFTSRYLKKPTLKRSVVVFVLGDVGRSPRMMYHAESFANNGFDTYVVGYRGSKPTPALLSTPHVQFFYLPQLPQSISRLPFMIVAPIKIIHQVLSIFITLQFTIPNASEFIITQNPPSIPTLVVIWFISCVRPTKVIIDWHNLGYTILALKLGEKHPVVRLAKLIEKFFGRTAYAHLFVTNAMRDSLVTQWNLRGLKIVLHDRPPSHFHRCSPLETHELFCRLGPNLFSSPLRSFLPDFEVPCSTPFTITVPAAPSIRPPRDSVPSPVHLPTSRAERTALLVSSTSWTADEDFGLLLEALEIYNRVASAKGDEGGLPRILVMITGKGPLKDMYMGKIQKTQHAWDFVRCISAWLDSADYPLLLGSADIGICLHNSSSALDLPMKIVDMFGCGLPVCALDFGCLQELLQPGWNGLIFKSSEELAGQLISLLRGFPRSPMLETLKSSLAKSLDTPSPSSAHSFGSLVDIGQDVSNKWEWTSWADNWNESIRPIVLGHHIIRFDPSLDLVENDNCALIRHTSKPLGSCSGDTTAFFHPVKDSTRKEGSIDNVARLATLLRGPHPQLIRIGVRNKGCAGLSYHLEYVDKPGRFDEVVEQDGVRVLIDSKALFTIIGSEMDWREDALSARFAFRNPNVKDACGCGESFTVGS